MIAFLSLYVPAHILNMLSSLLFILLLAAAFYSLKICYALACLSQAPNTSEDPYGKRGAFLLYWAIVFGLFTFGVFCLSMGALFSLVLPAFSGLGYAGAVAALPTGWIISRENAFRDPARLMQYTPY